MSTPRLLIISDDRQRVGKLQALLRPLSSWEVVVASSASVQRLPLALMMADAVLIDDNSVNDRSGCEKWVVECQRALRPIPVVAIRDYYDDQDALRCFEMGVSDFLSLENHSDRLPHLISHLTIEAALKGVARFSNSLRSRSTSFPSASTRPA